MGDFTLIVLLAIFVGLVIFAGTARISVYAAIIDLAFVVLAGRYFWTAASEAVARQDAIWYRLSIGFFIWGLAICLRLCEMALNQPGYGTLADTFWIVGYFPLIYGSYLWFRSAKPAGKSLRIVLLVFGLAGAAAIFLLLRPLLVDPDRSLLLKALDLIYAVLDLLMAGFVAVPAFPEEGRGSRTLMFAVVLLLVCDLLFSYFGINPSSWLYRYLDVPYTFAYFLLALAGKQQAQIMERRRPQLV